MNQILRFWLANVATVLGMLFIVFLFFGVWRMTAESLLVDEHSVTELKAFMNKELVLGEDNVDVIGSQLDMLDHQFRSWMQRAIGIVVLLLVSLITYVALLRTWAWNKKITKKAYYASVWVTLARTIGWLLLFWLCYHYLDSMNTIWPVGVSIMGLATLYVMSHNPITMKRLCLFLVLLLVGWYGSGFVMLSVLLHPALPYVLLLVWWGLVIAGMQVVFT